MLTERVSVGPSVSNETTQSAQVAELAMVQSPQLMRRVCTADGGSIGNRSMTLPMLALPTDGDPSERLLSAQIMPSDGWFGDTCRRPDPDTGGWTGGWTEAEVDMDGRRGKRRTVIGSVSGQGVTEIGPETSHDSQMVGDGRTSVLDPERVFV